MRPLFVTIVLVMVVIAALIVGLSYRCMNSLPVAEALAQKVTPGMTTDAVRTLLGKPSEIHLEDAGGARWVYSRWLVWTFFTVHFTPDGKVDTAKYGD